MQVVLKVPDMPLLSFFDCPLHVVSSKSYTILTTLYSDSFPMTSTSQQKPLSPQTQCFLTICKYKTAQCLTSTVQTYGFSPVCCRICCLRRHLRSKRLPHPSKLQRSSSCWSVWCIRAWEPILCGEQNTVLQLGYGHLSMRPENKNKT